MEDAKDLFGYDSLAFFGKVNASISHELKNVMAIISETAGLLGDLSDMASTGTPIEPDMLKNCTDSIVEEIQRGFATIRQMNRLAHSVDTPAGSVNLMDVLDLAIHLCGYLSFSGKTVLQRCEGFTPTALTCPFFLQAIVYQVLNYTFKNAGPEAEIGLSVRPQGGSAWRIIFSGFNLDALHVFPDVATQAMAASIGVTIHCDSTADHLALDVPLTMESLMVGQVSPAMPDLGHISRTPA
jgi:signal transduction histidine kinase